MNCRLLNLTVAPRSTNCGYSSLNIHLVPALQMTDKISTPETEAVILATVNTHFHLAHNCVVHHSQCQ